MLDVWDVPGFENSGAQISTIGLLYVRPSCRSIPIPSSIPRVHCFSKTYFTPSPVD